MENSEHVYAVTAGTFDTQVIERSYQTPVLVDFWAEWCAPCRSLVPVLEKLAGDYRGKFILAKVNSDEQQELAARFKVRSLPTVKLFINGEDMDEFMGALPEPAIREFLDRYIERTSDLMRKHADAALQQGDSEQAIAILQTALGEDPDNYRVHADLAQLLLTDGRVDECIKVIESLPANIQSGETFEGIRQQLKYVHLAGQAPEQTILEQQLENSPDDCELHYQLAARYILLGDYEPALEQMLEIMKRDRKFRDDAGRKGLIEIFAMLGNSGELVNSYRSRMSAILY